MANLLMAHTAPTVPAEMQKADMIDGLRKGLEVICAFDDATPRFSQSELAIRLNLSRAAARRYLMTLSALGYMATDGKSFWLTPKVMRLGHSYVAPASHRSSAASGKKLNMTRPAATVCAGSRVPGSSPVDISLGALARQM